MTALSIDATPALPFILEEGTIELTLRSCPLDEVSPTIVGCTPTARSSTDVESQNALILESIDGFVSCSALYVTTC